MKYSLAKLIISIILVLSYFVMPQYSFPGGGIIGHCLYPLSHANVFHLLANVVCLWIIPCGLHLGISYLMAVLCSFLPCFMVESTMGFSGVLFAVVGMSWGRVNLFKDMILKNKWWLLIPIFIPHVNALLHIWCLLCGWIVGRVWRGEALSSSARDWL